MEELERRLDRGSLSLSKENIDAFAKLLAFLSEELVEILPAAHKLQEVGRSRLGF